MATGRPETRLRLDKEYRTFIKGLITEATGLTYPEGSSRDLDNVDINTDGSVRRRLGISQENDGQAIGAGTLSDTLFTNNTGGPLSLAPSVIAESVSYSYDGTVTNSGDWTLGGFSASNDGSAWSLRAKNNNQSYMRADFDVTDFDSITLSFYLDETTSNEGNLLLLVGADNTGGGSGFLFNRRGVAPVTTTTYNTGYVVGSRLYDYDAENDNHNYTLTLTKVATNSYTGNLQIKDGATVVKVVPISIGMLGDFIYFISQSGQNSTCDWTVDDIDLDLALYGVEADLPDVNVADEAFAISTHSWVAPNGNGNKAFQVFQIGNTLFFRDANQESVSNAVDTDVPFVSQSMAFDGIGTGFIYNMSSSQAAQVKLQSATGFGRIWFTSRAVIPFYAELDEDGTSIRLRAVGTREGTSGIEAIVGQRLIRDLVGVDDGLETDETPGTLSSEHLYNLLNQGWPSDHINTYFTDSGNYPSNAQQWFFGKTSTESFDPSKLIAQDFGASQCAKGRFLLDALLGDRDGRPHAVSGITSPITFNDGQDVTSESGWEAAAFYAGRLWLAGEINSKRPCCVYASKTLEGVDDAGKFFQQGDPSAEHLSALVATDGLYIPIPEAGNIRKLVPFGSGLVVLADKGIWFIYGRQGGFTANNFSVEKISATGTVSPGTVIPTDRAVLYWAENSVHQVVFSDESNSAYLPSVQDIGQQTIFKYYQRIPRASRIAASSCYDPISKKAFWFWLSDGDEAKANTYQNLYNKALIFDTRTNAFTVYSFDAQDSNPLFGVAAAFARQTPTRPTIYEPVYDSTFETVLDSNDDVVYGPDGSLAVSANELTASLKLVLVSSVDEGLRIAEFASLSFVDFDGFAGVESSESTAFIVTGDETLGDLQRFKQATYVHSFFLRTETGFYPDQTPKRASGCTLRARWDWTNSAIANRWSDSQNAYRYRKPYAPPSFEDTFDTGEEILYTRLKARGKGRALSLKYESVAGKDFRLLGYSIPYTVNRG